MDSKLIGKNIRRARNRHFMTQREFAEKTELSATHIAHLECGSVNLSVDSLVKICEVLCVTPNDILRGAFSAKEVKREEVLNEYGLPIRQKKRDFILDIAELLTRYQHPERFSR